MFGGVYPHDQGSNAADICGKVERQAHAFVGIAGGFGET